MKRFEVWLVNLDPTIGSEIKRTRPAIIVSPNELNSHLRSVIIVPLTQGRAYSFRVATQVQGKKGVAAVDQIRTVDKQRLVKRLSKISSKASAAILQTISEMFAD